MGRRKSNQEDWTMTHRERTGKTPATESASHPPTKRGKKASSTSSNGKNIFKGHLSYMNDENLAFARKRYISLAKLNVQIEKFVNEDDLDEIGVKDRVVELIARGGFGGLWRLRGDIWEEIVKEIFAIMKLSKDKKFYWVCLKGKPLHMSFHDFAEACDVYEGESSDVGFIAPKLCWKTGGAASELGISKNKFWSELCGQEGLKFVGGVSKISKVKDVSIRIFHRWLVTSICGNAKDGAVTERQLTCLFGMVKGIYFDKSKFLLWQMRGNCERKKGEIYGGLYLTHFTKRFHESLPGITIIKPINVCTIRYLKGNHPDTTKSKRTKDAIPSYQPSEFNARNSSEDVDPMVMNHLPLITVAEMEEQHEDMPFLFKPSPPTMNLHRQNTLMRR